jgi:coiled-coil domain-containing protein 40
MLATEIETKKQEVEDETGHNRILQIEIEEGLLLKQENLENIVRKQYRARRYRALLNGKQRTKIRSEAQIQSDYKHQKSINDELCQIMENLQLEVPEQKFGILKIIQTLKTI